MAKAKAAPLPPDFMQVKGAAEPSKVIPQTAPAAPDIVTTKPMLVVAPAADPAPPAKDAGAKPATATAAPAQAPAQAQAAEPPQQANGVVVAAAAPGVQWLDLQPGAVLEVQPEVQGVKAMTVKVPNGLYRQIKMLSTITGQSVQEMGVEGFKLLLRSKGVAV